MIAAADLAEDSEPLLRVDRLGCMRGPRWVLDEVTLTLRPGDLLVVTGPNGSGKSTLLRCLAGLLAPLGGTIGGTAIALGSILHVGHADPVKSHMTVAENLDFWADLAGGGARRPAEAAAAFGLAALVDVPAHILSAGQRRRLSLARLLLSPALLWLLDEPANALDSDGLDRLLAAVADHRAAGGAVVVATHDALPFPEPQHLALSDGPAAC